MADIVRSNKIYCANAQALGLAMGSLGMHLRSSVDRGHCQSFVRQKEGPN